MKKRFMGIVVIVCCLTMAITCLADYDSSVIQQVQQALNDAGFDCGTPDGIAGKGTAAAVSAYQEANGLTVDGQISEELLTSLGIGAVTSEDASSETAAPDGTTDAPGEFSEDAYDGEWTSISDKYEIYLPAGMTIADDEELEQLSESSYYDMSTYLFSATADTGMKIQHLRISDDFISQLKEAGAGINSAQDYWDLWKEQISNNSRTGNINGIDGLYVDNSDGNDGSPIPTYAWSADDEIHFFEFSNCGDENGIELAKTIMESLRIAENADIEETELAEAVETVAEIETESAAAEAKEVKSWTPDMVVTFYFVGGMREVYSYDEETKYIRMDRYKAGGDELALSITGEDEYIYASSAFKENADVLFPELEEAYPKTELMKRFFTLRSYDEMITYTDGENYYEVKLVPGGTVIEKKDGDTVLEQYTGEEAAEMVKNFIDTYILDEEKEAELAAE